MVLISSLRLSQLVAKEAAANTAIASSLRLPPLPTTRDLLKLYKIRAQRSLSQNFIMDSRVTNKIVTTSGNVKNCYVCEVGPGPGNITRSILQNGAKHVIAIEKDKRFLPSLQLLADASGGRMQVILGDIMDLTLENILPKELACDWTVESPPLYIIGNLPFNISTPLIIKWLQHCSTHTGPFVHGRTKLTLTFQKEVGSRIVADVGSDCRCRLSVICQYLCHVNNMFTIPGKSFVPPPDVDVAVVNFKPRIVPLIQQPFKIVNKVVSTIFHHRQKQCRYGIRLLFPESKEELAEEMILQTNINPKKKSLNLEMEEFKLLCDKYSYFCKEYNGLLEYNYQNRKLDFTSRNDK